MAVTGGDKLVKHLAGIAARVREANTVSVGFLEGATYPDGTSVPMVAAINEFGAPARGQPPRPFFRNMIAQDGPGWGDQVAAVLKATDYDAPRSLQLMGEEIRGQLQDSILQLVDPPLAPSTVAAKGFDKPLIDTSVMLNSVDYEVT